MAEKSNNHQNLNKIFFHSAELMQEVGDNSVRLAISFPPFLHDPNAAKLDKPALMSMLNKIYKEVFRVLAPQGFLVSVNTDVRDRAEYDKNHRGRSGTVWWKHQSIR